MNSLGDFRDFQNSIGISMPFKACKAAVMMLRDIKGFQIMCFMVIYVFVACLSLN